MAHPRSGTRAAALRSCEGRPSRFEDALGIEGLLDAPHQEIAVRSGRPRRKTRAQMLGAPLYPSRAADHARRDQERFRVADHRIVVANEMRTPDPACYVDNEHLEGLKPRRALRERGRRGEWKSHPHECTIDRPGWKLAHSRELVSQVLGATLAFGDLVARVLHGALHARPRTPRLYREPP